MKKILLVAAALFTTSAFGDPVHIMDHINTTDGNWSGRLTIISANEPAYFTDAQKNNKGSTYDFTTQATQPFSYGFGIIPGKTDFNVAYSLTLTQKPAADTPLFTAKTCVFLITATSPATPDIRTESFNNATCKAAPSNDGDTYTIS
ncbi:MAG: hypothetical protein COB66_03730 [Coxiella sp. (in: Bacteria)]|nr:MAG: hypothetical protein COB66_03730 [Coxiella sp. (in: g-proteobacteria)]